MPEVALTHTHVSKVVTGIVDRYQNPDISYIADVAITNIPVKKETDKYVKWLQSAWFRDEVQEIADGMPYPIGGPDVATAEYSLTEKGLATRITKRMKENSDSEFQLQVNKAKWLKDKHMLNHEIKMAAQLFSNSIFTNTEALSGTSQWSDFDDSAPVKKIMDTLDAVRKTGGGIKPNTCIMGIDVWLALKAHPEIIGAIFGGGFSGPKMVTEALFTQYFSDQGLRNTYVGGAVKTTTPQVSSGTPAGNEANVTYSNIWGKHFWVGYVHPAPSSDFPTSVTTLRKNMGPGLYNEVNTGSTVLTFGRIDIIKVISINLARLITDAVA